MSVPTPDTSHDSAGRSRLPLPLGAMAGFVLAIIAVVTIAWLSYRALEERAIAAEAVRSTIAKQGLMDDVLGKVIDAETGQRGYLLTGEERYLEPYNTARAELVPAIDVLRASYANNEEQLRRIAAMEAAIVAKLAELEETIVARRAGNAERAMDIVRSDRGRNAMDRVRAIVDEIDAAERVVLDRQQAAWEKVARDSVTVTTVGALVLLVLIVAAAYMTSRDYRLRVASTWVRAGQAGLASRLQGEQRLERLGESVLGYLARYLDVPAGAVYIADGDGYRRFGAYGIDVGADDSEIRPGDGLLGQAAAEGRTLHVRDVPAGYLTVRSSLGRAAPRELVVSPAIADGMVHAVIELGFFRRADAADMELLTRVSEMLAIAVRSSRDRTRLEELLEETQRQSEELQTQQEELRVTNEELEEQGRALRESQGQLESQQVELEQTNAQLEEQAQQLEGQRDDLATAQNVLIEKATELERANRYKSEFLANMSHELRTPLNSTLILAKLLADNKHGNLDQEQVRFAQTICSAGNDLLALINDILDLSKIESGKVEVAIETVPVAEAVEAQARAFLPLAQQKGLQLTMQVAAGAPTHLDSDPLRLGQILRNLVANAVKFTDQGEVELRVSAATGDAIAFAVRDTGIGIADEQREIIFEAFRQADGSTHRRYGGTGLGLSIARELARVLGGDIAVDSAPGRGSTFTLTLPRVYSGAAERSPIPAGGAVMTTMPAFDAGRPAASAAPVLAPRPAAGEPAAPGMLDDRARLAADTRRILVIEDDIRFAAILRDLAHEMGFQCVITHTAGDGLMAATRYRPHAILLDMNLPDHSGLGVLDQLKRDPLMRHVPVHVISVADYSQEALELGAVGYALKPVQREELITAIHRLEAKIAQGVRRVLVVEDDARQRDSIGRLLGNGGVEIVGVETAAEALDALRDSTFDCMVMDLNLPDMSGYELLERMAQQDEVAFPPVIVYTGRELSRDEEHNLRRFSRSIIIKDARSPERLLDEVTLFLHQVESTLPAESQRLLRMARDRESALDGRRILVVEDDVRNIFALSSLLEPKGAKIEIARNGREALAALERSRADGAAAVDLVLMDIMMPEMDGLTAMREIRKRPEWKRLPIIALTAKAMRDDQEKCLAAGANDYIAKPLDIEKLLSLVRVWMPRGAAPP